MKSALLYDGPSVVEGKLVAFSLASLWGLACVERQLFILLLLFLQLAVQLHFLPSLRPVGCEQGGKDQ